ARAKTVTAASARVIPLVAFKQSDDGRSPTAHPPLQGRRVHHPGATGTGAMDYPDSVTHHNEKRVPMTDFTVLKNLQPQPELVRENIKKDPGFGQYFTDHMAHIRYTVDDGWQAHEVKPYGPLVLDPAAAVLHYAHETFDALKCYRRADGPVSSFRPERDAARIYRSAERLALAQLSEEDFINSLKARVCVDQAWVPTPQW